ncbi:MAG TPA: ABC transporter permease [Ilumatobacter sp.]|nr:ABC transporter permease [Ilumatobacter sp.]
MPDITVSTRPEPASPDVAGPLATELAAQVVDQTLPDVAPPELRQMRSYEIVAAAVAGVVSIYVGLAVLTSVTAEVRIALTVVGLLALFVAYRGLGRRLAGPEFRAGWWLAVAWLVLVVLSAVFADLLPFTEARNPSKTFSEPVLAPPDLLSRHPLGTDRQGLDILGGIAYGLRVSVTVGLGAVAIGMVVGGVIGTIAGYRRKAIDHVIELFTNSMLAFPPLVLLLGVAAVLERNTLNTTLALSVVAIPVYVRLARSTAIVVSQREFVTAARAIGAKDRHIIIRDIIPIVVRPVMAYGFVMIAALIVAEASLSFLGLGIPRPKPTLGNMISAGQSDFDRYPHLVFAPAIVLLITVLCLNQVGEYVQEKLSPKQAKI